MNPTKFVSRLTRKSRSNFFYAFLCLPRPQREALYAVYAFCRIVDDAVDVGQDQAAKRKELGRWRAEITQVFDGSPAHPAAQRLQEAVKLFPIPREALNEIIAGVEMDLDRSTYKTFDELYPYCYRVASAVGLCCIEIFGYSDARAGRVYLPQEDLERFGVAAADLAAGRYTPEFLTLMEYEAARAHVYYERAWATLPRSDEHRLFAAEIMGRTYFALLETIERRRFQVFGARVSVPTPRKLGIALRCWVQSRWGEKRA